MNFTAYKLSLINSIVASSYNITNRNIINFTIIDPSKIKDYKLSLQNLRSPYVLSSSRENYFIRKFKSKDISSNSTIISSVTISYKIRTNIPGIHFSNLIAPLNKSIINGYFNKEMHSYSHYYGANGLYYSFSGPLEAIQLYPIMTDDIYVVIF